MKPEEIDALISELIIPQEKPSNTKNSYHRKQWENRRKWRRCTIHQTCKLGNLKDYEKLYQFYNKFNQWLGWVSYLQSEDRKLSYITYEVKKHKFKWVSYNSKYHRKTAARHVRAKLQMAGYTGKFMIIFNVVFEIEVLKWQVGEVMVGVVQRFGNID